MIFIVSVACSRIVCCNRLESRNSLISGSVEVPFLTTCSQRSKRSWIAQRTVRLLNPKSTVFDGQEKHRVIASDTVLSPVGVKSMTPPGSPPKDFIPLTAGQQQPAKTTGNATGAPAADTSAILKALADMAKTNTGASGMPAQASSSNVTSLQNSFPQNMSVPVNPNPSVLPVSQAVGVPGANPASTFAGMSSASGNLPPRASNGQSNMQVPPALPLPGNGSPAMTPEIQHQLQILQALQAQGVPQDQWANVLSVIMAGGAGAAAPNQSGAPQHGWQQPQAGGYGDQSRDRNGLNQQSIQSPSGRFRNPRSRSRSPAAWDRRGNASPPRRRDSPVYGEYGRDARDNDRDGYGRGRGGNAFRQRSPNRRRRSPSPRRGSNEPGLPPPGSKLVEHDPTLRQGMIKGKSYQVDSNGMRIILTINQCSVELCLLVVSRKS